MTEFEFPLPDVGEGLTEAEIVSWRVAPGDEVVVNQVLCEIETAKSLVELPSPFAGEIRELLVEEGTTVDVGSAIVAIDDHLEESAGPASSGGGDAAPAAAPASGGPADGGAPEEGSVLVGYGAATHSPSRRQKRTGGTPRALVPPPHEGRHLPASEDLVPAAATAGVVAKPPIRKLAKDLGVDLARVEPTGLAGEVTREDVVREARQASVFHNLETPEWPSDREERIPVKGVRKQIAQAMTSSAFTAPHVSVFTEVDATRTMEFVARLKDSPDFADVKVSPLLIMAKAIVWAVQRNPSVNSTWTAEEIIVHHFVNLGVAAATPRGLIVPNVKEAQSLSLLELARALEALTLTAREGRTPPKDMAGGTITVTNIGVFGMDTGTPILNPGEVAIVAMGRIARRPWVVDGEVRPRWVTTVGGSFDHRVVDGDVVSRFVADVASVLEEPALLLD